MEQRDPDDEKHIFMFFGRDVSKIPCFRNSFLYGMSSGIACGLATFLFTSRPKKACDLGMISFCIITLGYWTQCRYNFSKMKFEMDRVKTGLQTYIAVEGTPDEIDDGKPVDV